MKPILKTKKPSVFVLKAFLMFKKLYLIASSYRLLTSFQFTTFQKAFR